MVSDQPDTIATHFPRGLDNPDAAWTPLHLTTSLMRLYSQIINGLAVDSFSSFGWLTSKEIVLTHPFAIIK